LGSGDYFCHYREGYLRRDDLNSMVTAEAIYRGLVDCRLACRIKNTVREGQNGQSATAQGGLPS
jgi:hypothetical protein